MCAFECVCADPDTKGTWTCYKAYAQTDPDLCTKGGVCAGFGF